MSELPPPYTGKTEKAPAKPAAKPAAKKPAAAKPPAKPKEPPVAPVESTAVVTPPVATAPVLPGPPASFAVVWHSRAVLIAVAGAALISAILTAVGSAGFPGAAPVEQLYAFGLIVDLVAVVATLGALTIVEFVRRGNLDRRARPVKTQFSVFAIIALACAVLAGLFWATTGGVEQLLYLVQGIRPRYMYATGGLFVAGVPWALAAIFGAWGFRPRANPVTNVFALLAILTWLVLAAVTTLAALVYGAGLSD